MTNIEQLADQGRRLLEQFMPSDAGTALNLVFPAGVAVVGLIAAVLGARLARPAMTAALATCGAAGGAAVGGAMQVSVPAAAAAGAVICGVVGFVMHRLWVAAAAFVLFAGVASGTMGYYRVLPQVEGFAQSPPAVFVPPQELSVSVASTGRACCGKLCQLAINPGFEEWAGDVWREARAKDRALPRDLALVSVAAGLLGFLSGLVAVRLTLVVATSVIGTMLLVSGTGGILNHVRPEWYEASMGRPQMVGIAWGAVLIGSLALQGLLTRPDKSRGKKTEK